MVTGRSGQKRKLELLVEYPFEIVFGEMFAAEVPILIAVDCKDYTKRVNINHVGQFADQMDDIGSPVGTMVAPRGFTKGAEGRAKQKNIFLIHATWDLMLLAKGLKRPEFNICSACVDSEGDHTGIVNWENPPKWAGIDFWPCLLRGSCHRCGTYHVFCPDCGAVTGFMEADEDECIECSGGCDRVYLLRFDQRRAVYHLETFDRFDRAILEAAMQKGGRLSESQYRKIVDRSKWRYFAEGCSPTELLEGEGWMEREEIDDERSRLVLTDKGREFCEEYLAGAGESHYEW